MEKDLFTPCLCEYDPLVDIAEVDQFGYLDLRQAFLTGTVDGSIAPEETAFNGVDDPDGILPAARDQFEAIRQAEYASSVMKSRKNVASAATPAPSTEGDGASFAATE